MGELSQWDKVEQMLEKELQTAIDTGEGLTIERRLRSAIRVNKIRLAHVECQDVTKCDVCAVFTELDIENEMLVSLQKDLAMFFVIRSTKKRIDTAYRNIMQETLDYLEAERYIKEAFNDA